MKKPNMEANQENVLISIMEDTYNRSQDIKDFVMALDTIEENMFISLDAKWGAGKSFYVRQIENTLKYLTAKQYGCYKDWYEDKKQYFVGNRILDSIVISKSYLPIYYNAWLYDNQDDPLMSLLSILIKESGKKLDTKVGVKSISEKFCEIARSANITYKGMFTIGGITPSTANDILETIKTADEICFCVKAILDQIINETAQKLIIFIDELDRCKPSFAIEMLERIKHYFDDDRIIFVASVNKEQLVNTISKYYGNGFDSTMYLNKFFDYNVYFPEIVQNDKVGFGAGTFCLRDISSGLSEYYRLTLRDSIIYESRLNDLNLNNFDDSYQPHLIMSIFVPIVLILDIVDIKKKTRFLKGNDSIIFELAQNIFAIKKAICRLSSDKGNFSEDNFNTGYEIIKEVYHFYFDNSSGDHDYDCYKGNIFGINKSSAKKCLKTLNGFLKS